MASRALTPKELAATKPGASRRSRWALQLTGVWRRLIAWARHVRLGRYAAIGLMVAAIASGIATYATLTGTPSYGVDRNPDAVFVLLNVNLVLLLLMGALIARRVVRLWAERRRGLAGSRLHVRLVLLFALVAVTPAIVVAVFSAIFFNFGIQAWFSDRVSEALRSSLNITSIYLKEHQQTIRADALAMAGTLNRNASVLMRSNLTLRQVVVEQAAARALPEAVVFDGSGTVLASSNLSFALQLEPVPPSALKRAQKGEVAIMAKPGAERVRALVKLDRYFDTYLYVGRFIDPKALGYVARAQEAVGAYQQLESQRSLLQISFLLVYAVVAMLLLLAAVWVGLLFANQLMRPIGALIGAADRIRAGDLTARVKEDKDDVDIGGLGRAFNRMAKRLERNRKDLMEANRQLDARRQFTETVLAGVSAGVIGLDAEGRVNLPNRSATELLSTDLHASIGKPLAKVVPEMAPLLDDARRSPEMLVQSEVVVARGGGARTLLARIATEHLDGKPAGFVVTFDDITDLQAAQRKAAWADVARRIAHEIKNPLTPIQLSAERLKRKYLDEIVTEPDVFVTCTDTIVRQVSDIGRMVDEFSAFARMPAPVMDSADIAEICEQAVFLRRNADSEITYRAETPKGAVTLRCDARQVSQAVINLLKNASESILDRNRTNGQKSVPGQVVLRLSQSDRETVIEVEDNGPGLPKELQHRLTEPYVTTRKKGTGLGLAIVAKIMEDHGGTFTIENRPSGGGALARLTFALGKSGTSPKGASSKGTASKGTSSKGMQAAKTKPSSSTRQPTGKQKTAVHGS